MKNEQKQRNSRSKNAQSSSRARPPLPAWNEIRRSILAKLSRRILNGGLDGSVMPMEELVASEKNGEGL
jgi:hypothetical protein